jgi:hypothetical protein
MGSLTATPSAAAAFSYLDTPCVHHVPAATGNSAADSILDTGCGSQFKLHTRTPPL